MTSIDFIHDTNFESLPKSTITEAVRYFVDTLGVAVGGSQTQVAHIIHNHATHQFGGDAATLWQDGRSVSAAGAALANGMTIDSLDAHDGHKLTKGYVGCGGCCQTKPNTSQSTTIIQTYEAQIWNHSMRAVVHFCL